MIGFAAGQSVRDAFEDTVAEIDAIHEDDWPTCLAWTCTLAAMLRVDMDYLTATRVIRAFFMVGESN